MDLVQIARFADVTEAQVAASALRASGIEVFVQNENLGQTVYLTQQALGGFGLMVAAGDAADAHALIAQARAQPREPVESPRRAKGWVAVVLGLLIGSPAP